MYFSVGRFALDFGSKAILYEVNHRTKNNFLFVEKRKQMGPIFLRGPADYYSPN